MLVLSRFVNQSIVVGEDVVVTVVEVTGGRDGPRVKLGITAPEGIRIDRVEVRQAKDRGRKGADG
jgi:carbon storage regulator